VAEDSEQRRASSDKFGWELFSGIACEKVCKYLRRWMQEG
jgi:hypothetical protein